MKTAIGEQTTPEGTVAKEGAMYVRHVWFRTQAVAEPQILEAEAGGWKGPAAVASELSTTARPEQEGAMARGAKTVGARAG